MTDREERKGDHTGWRGFLDDPSTSKLLSSSTRRGRKDDEVAMRKGQVRFDIPQESLLFGQEWKAVEMLEVRVQCGVSGKVFLYDVGYAVAASTLLRFG
jgi:hypothetical protein